MLEKAADVVKQPLFFAQCLDIGGDFRAAVRGHVGEHVVFNLMAQVAAHDVKKAPAFQISRARQLA